MSRFDRAGNGTSIPREDKGFERNTKVCRFKSPAKRDKEERLVIALSAKERFRSDAQGMEDGSVERVLLERERHLRPGKWGRTERIF